ncbi:two-component system sensor histidine kinase CreC [Rhodoferax ferrireducens]|uniref:two-component system sensor histidine kinase CreC n=1 Tax=Rhodoferax ferrireducens TaxID=192843 RepID=UPI000E0D3355|nr:two-component system sensor histidine kinase CreC [Rhodoferax ferrireducens]
MSKRTRIFIGILFIYTAGIAFMLYRVVADLDPRYRESAEESLVETSQLLASLIEQDVRDGALDTARLEPVFKSLYARRFDARIFSVTKTRVELRAYVTDRSGQVVFDSTGQALGADFSQWRDVRMALKGDYGARTTPDVAGEPDSSVMYVGAPVRWAQDGNGEIIGTVTVGKPVHSFGQFVSAAREKIIYVGLVSMLAVLVLVVMVSVWLVRPFGLIRDYVRYVRSQQRFSLPRMGRRAMDVLGAAYDEMRDALAGRNYVADYVQTLTHEVKSPLSAIRGAAELLQEPMPEAQRQRFLANIQRETQRIQEMVDRMMELTALETRRVLERVQPVALRPLLEELAGATQGAAAQRRIRIELNAPADVVVEGDPFLLRRALSNLLDNALDFSPEGSVVQLSLTGQRRHALIAVRDQGCGIPGYAQDKVFEKFYSLARPHSQKKSTGLGLSFVKEIAALHHGRIELHNRSEEEGPGTAAILALPRAPA